MTMKHSTAARRLLCAEGRWIRPSEKLGVQQQTRWTINGRFLQAEDFAGFGRFYRSKTGHAAATEDTRCAYTRRETYDVHLTASSPIAAAPFRRIGRLFEA